MAKTKRINNDKQNIIHKTKDRVTRTPQKPGMISGRDPLYYKPESVYDKWNISVVTY
jgi:hypothetical protein